MATPTEILTAFRQHLVDQGIVRKPGAGPQPNGAPPMFVEPDDGPIGPGEAPKAEENDDQLVLSIFWGGALAATDADAYRLRGSIDVRLRSSGSAGVQRAAAVAMRIRREMFEPGDSPGIARRAWVMGGLNMLETGEWGGLSRIHASESEGFDDVWKAYVETYAS